MISNSVNILMNNCIASGDMPPVPDHLDFSSDTLGLTSFSKSFDLAKAQVLCSGWRPYAILEISVIPS